eukprot:137224-Pelagomonas_calceolata.AAC.9
MSHKGPEGPDQAILGRSVTGDFSEPPWPHPSLVMQKPFCACKEATLHQIVENRLSVCARALKKGSLNGFTLITYSPNL